MRKKEDIETIYRAALTVFSRYGFRKTTLEDIAGQLGMTKSNLYLYAKNKKDLYRRTVSWALTRWQSRVRHAVDRERDARKQFTVMCFKAIDYLSQDNDFRRLLAHDPDIFPMFPEKDPYRDINRRSVAMIKRILKKGVEEQQFRQLDIDRVSEAVFLIYKMFVIRTYVKTEGKPMLEMFADIFDLLTEGLFLEKAKTEVKGGKS